MVELTRFQPLIVPAAYYETGNWDLPHVLFPNREFILTWVEDDGKAIMYLDRDTFDNLNTSKVGWQQQALDNIRQSNYFHRHYKGATKTQPDWIAFLNDEDVISSSKVLLHFELSRIFPEGYYVAIPDRACGIIVSSQCSGEILVEVQQMIERLYNDATTPMSPNLYPAADFQLPTGWSEPLKGDSTSAAILSLFGS
ncbi:hypothetical protein [Hymenobacter sp. GOD-10R]|uniref:hypothetical protein n=1 Tax=Hymenobacter sp. GOD-10R TaxID=3093922 RepID=UPI002D771208|nr:hypothetical protein [Hymenobacter sp. GOD-10R]WRQ26202.1 hypothetical protein SD425_14050 [Hymenobacter sp. GOD-10R]